MLYKNLVIVFLFTILGSALYAQKGVSFEAGLNLGAASLQTDYGERGDFQSGVTGNVGFSIGGVAYLNFFDKNTNWNDRSSYMPTHFKLKGEIGYMKAKLEHFGSWMNQDNPTADKLRAMTGSSSLFNIGTTLEFHFNDIYEFYNHRGSNWDPYIGLGAHLNFSKPTVESSLGDYQTDPNVLIEKYQTNAIFVEKQTIGSMAFSLGTRFKSQSNGNFFIETRWQYYFSNQIDGLDPKDDSNKFNDWLSQLSVGYIFYFK